MSARNTVETFLARVRKRQGCWLYQGYLRPDGYGYARHDNKKVLLHRFVYEATKGSIPQGLVLDHLCRNRSCINPDHLEPVTHQTNILRGVGRAAEQARQTSCFRGHPFDEENTVRYGSNRRRRFCGTCQQLRRRTV